MMGIQKEVVLKQSNFGPLLQRGLT